MIYLDETLFMNSLIKSMVFYMPEPALLYTLNKNINPITFSVNKACIGNDSLTTVGRRLYHNVGDLGSCQSVRDLGFCSRVWGPGSKVLPESPGFCYSGMPLKCFRKC